MQTEITEPTAADLIQFLADNEDSLEPSDAEALRAEIAALQAPKTESVQAQYLKIGDRIPGRHGARVVTHSPSRGVKTPRGKVDLGLDGYKVTWGASTEITVERAQ